MISSVIFTCYAPSSEFVFGCRKPPRGKPNYKKKKKEWYSRRGHPPATRSGRRKMNKSRKEDNRILLEQQDASAVSPRKLPARVSKICGRSRVSQSKQKRGETMQMQPPKQLKQSTLLQLWIVRFAAWNFHAFRYEVKIEIGYFERPHNVDANKKRTTWHYFPSCLYG